MRRRERVLAHLAEHPGLSTAEIAKALDGGRGGDYKRLLTDMQRKGQLLQDRQPRPGRGRVQVWLVAPPGTKPAHIPDPDLENKRRRDREYQRRVRAKRRGENVAEAVVRQPSRRLNLPVAAADLGDWRKRAGCRTADPELFFSHVPADIAQAQQVCAGCPVRRQCLEYAEANDEQFGVWAGIDRGPPARGADRIVIRTWPANQTGPCGSCRQPTRRYGPEGGTLCPDCRPEAELKSSPEVRSGPKAVVIAPRPAPEFDQPELFA